MDRILLCVSLLTIVPAVPSWTQAAGFRYFPHVGDGICAPCQFRTTIVFVDTGGSAEIALDFLDEEGNPRVVDLPPLGKHASFKIALKSGNSLSRMLPLAPGEKLAKSVCRFFEGDLNTIGKPQETGGTLTVVGNGIRLGAATPRQLNACQPFPKEVAALATFPVVGGTTWNLVWSDEFDGPDWDRQKWETQLGNGCSIGLCGWGNNEKEYYTDRPENLRIENGKLVIEARKDRPRDRSYPYSSARIRTKGKADWKYGRFEIRAKLPKGKGMWPALWLLPTVEVYGAWAASGEIDLMEMAGHEPSLVCGTLHYGGAWPRNVSSGMRYQLPRGDFSQDFHDFAMEWEEGQFRWYVDGLLFATRLDWSTQGFPFPAPFDQRFHLIMNLAVGGDWPGGPDSTTVFPQRLEVDFVRVYQRAP